MVSLLERHGLVSRAFALTFGLQVFLIVIVLACALISKQKTDEVLAFNEAAEMLNQKFEQVTLTFHRFYGELAQDQPSEPYLLSLQENFVEDVSHLKTSIAVVSRPSRSFIATQEDQKARQIMKDVTPRIRAFIERIERIVAKSTAELKANYSAASIVDLAAARNGTVRRSLNELAELSRSRQTRIFRFIYLFMISALTASSLLLVGSWVWLIKPALSRQRETLIREAEITHDLEVKNKELSQSETRARLLYEDAMKGTRARTEFLAVVSHELRTPLNAVIGYSEVMKNEMYGKHEIPSYLQYSENIFSSGHHLLNIVDDILEFSRFESGKLELKDHEFLPVQQITSELWQLVRNKADTAGVQLFLHDLTDGNFELKVDSRLLLQALVNLTDNAIKFSDSGGAVVVSITAMDAGELSLSVSDTGIGIDLTEAARLLEPFEQVESAYGRNSEGLGLGLAITSNIVKAHNGRIDIESSIGEGSKFSILLPGDRVRVAANLDHQSNAA